MYWKHMQQSYQMKLQAVTDGTQTSHIWTHTYVFVHFPQSREDTVLFTFFQSLTSSPGLLVLKMNYTPYVSIWPLGFKPTTSAAIKKCSLLHKPSENIHISQAFPSNGPLAPKHSQAKCIPPIANSCGFRNWVLWESVVLWNEKTCGPASEQQHLDKTSCSWPLPESN